VPEREPRKFGWLDAVELLALVLVGVGTGLMWGVGAALAIVGGIPLLVGLLPKMVRNARGGDKRRAD